MLTTPQRLLMLETLVQLDLELAYVDLQIARVLERRGQVPQRRRQVPRRAARRFWVRSWFLDRPQDGQFRLLMDKLRLKDVAAFKNFTRMDPDLFFYLVERLTPAIEMRNTSYREAIPPAERLALTLRYYATGSSYMSLRYNWYMGDNTISKIVRQVSKAIIEILGEELLMPPTTQEGWLQVASQFSQRWNFHHTLGAIDGKHVALRKPAKSGSLYYNYKGFFSIILMAVVDAEYKFLWVDVGTNGACSDGQVFNDCELKEMVEKDKMGIPAPEPFPNEDRDIPYFFIGDDAFALRTWLMKPFSKRDLTRQEQVFNYRLSRARRIVENAFGILVNRFGCLLTTLRVTPSTATDVVMACCILHNLLRNANAAVPRGLVDEEDDAHNMVPGTFRGTGDLTSGASNSGGNTSAKDAKALRQYLKEYYNDVGAVDWQDRVLDAWDRN